MVASGADPNGDLVLSQSLTTNDYTVESVLTIPAGALYSGQAYPLK